MFLLTLVWWPWCILVCLMCWPVNAAAFALAPSQVRESRPGEPQALPHCYVHVLRPLLNTFDLILRLFFLQEYRLQWDLQRLRARRSSRETWTLQNAPWHNEIKTKTKHDPLCCYIICIIRYYHHPAYHDTMDVMMWSNCWMKNVERSSSGAASTKHHRAGALLGTSAVQLFSENHLWNCAWDFKSVYDTKLHVSINTSSLLTMLLLELCLLVCPQCRARHCIFSYCEANLDSQFHGVKFRWSFPLMPNPSNSILDVHCCHCVTKMTFRRCSLQVVSAEYQCCSYWSGLAKLEAHRLPFPNGVQGANTQLRTQAKGKVIQSYNTSIKWSSCTSGVKHLQATS